MKKCICILSLLACLLSACGHQNHPGLSMETESVTVDSVSEAAKSQQETVSSDAPDLMTDSATETIQDQNKDLENWDEDGVIILTVPNNQEGGVALHLDPAGNTGPSGFVIISDDNILILEGTAPRILHYQNNVLTESFVLGNCDIYTNIEYDGRMIYAFGYTGICCIEPETGQQRIYPYPDRLFTKTAEKPQVFIGNTFCLDGEIMMSGETFGCYSFDRNQERFLKTEKGFQIKRTGDTHNGNTLGNLIKVTSGECKWIIEAPDAFADVIGTTSDGCLLAVITDGMEAGDPERITVRKYDAESREIARLRVDTSRWAAYPRHFAEKGTDGSVYIMEVLEQRTEIRKYTTRESFSLGTRVTKELTSFEAEIREAGGRMLPPEDVEKWNDYFDDPLIAPFLSSEYEYRADIDLISFMYFDIKQMKNGEAELCSREEEKLLQSRYAGGQCPPLR